MREIAVGVDAGGTSTTAVVSRDGVVVGSAAADAANASSLGVEAAAAAIARAIGSALGTLTADSIVVGAAGAGRDGATERITAALRVHFPHAAIEVHDDASIALWAGAPAGDGIALIAGTGSIAFAHVDGQNYRSGGYGYLLGDEGSGYALGVAAARALVRALDGRAPRDPFVESIATALDIDDLAGALEVVYAGTHPVGKIAALAPLVVAAADGGDRLAGKIVQSAALELADLVKSVVRAAGIGDRELPLVFAGGGLQSNSTLTFLLETRLSNEFPNLRIVKGAPAPHFGALARAQRVLREKVR
ncbi:MAG TPA: BadF/BadG/BcrA/BcrD ATPase family protein [Verrucomicrobiae bacterium]|jgi:N-acetylglucosamine kinase-like BadF-type ATPase|nr:BadF/BadG/BcrA/BcrD ATPase family protein [Verrucomicrobiae bacterium]